MTDHTQKDHSPRERAMNRTPHLSPATVAVRAGIDTDTAHGAVSPPIVLSTNFTFDGLHGKRKYDYTRSGNPTRDLLGEALAQLEGGAGGVITGTGMGAITLVLHALLKPGQRLLIRMDNDVSYILTFFGALGLVAAFKKSNDAMIMGGISPEWKATPKSTPKSTPKATPEVPQVEMGAVAVPSPKKDQVVGKIAVPKNQ